MREVGISSRKVKAFGFFLVCLALFRSIWLHFGAFCSISLYLGMIKAYQIARGERCGMKTTALQSFAKNNPFTPVFGKVPPHLAGREQIVADILAAFESPQNNPDRCTMFVGARGTGKTALLTYLGDCARANGWITANVTAMSGMLSDIMQQASRAADHLVDSGSSTAIKSVSLAGIGGIAWEKEEQASSNWRTGMSSLLDQLAECGVGLVITVDEVDPTLDEIIQLVTTYQHFVREERDVILLMAGLPHRISALLSGETTSFLRRAARRNLGNVADYAVEEAFRLTVEEGGKTIAREALADVVSAINGFPFMFQLVGYRAWNASGEHKVISAKDVEIGARLARAELKDRIFDATFNELSPADVAFLRAMMVDETVTNQSDLRERLHKSPSHVSTYKKRLLEAGVIEEPMRGSLSFALPGFREYLQELFA